MTAFRKLWALTRVGTANAQGLAFDDFNASASPRFRLSGDGANMAALRLYSLPRGIRQR